MTFNAFGWAQGLCLPQFEQCSLCGMRLSEGEHGLVGADDMLFCRVPMTVHYPSKLGVISSDRNIVWDDGEGAE